MRKMRNGKEWCSEDYGYVLDNGEDLHQEAPDTFFLPSRQDRESLRAGDLVKLIFRMVEPDDSQFVAERMWVQVQEVEAARFVGVLDNDPYALTTIKAGHVVHFGPEHVIEIFQNSS